MKPLVVAQAPSRLSDPSEPLSGASGRRLAALCDLPHAEFLARFERVNLLREYPGKAGKGDAFPLAAARDYAELMREKVAASDVTVLLGANVARAFGLRAAPLSWTRFSRDCGLVAVCPHPSGVNRWWNDPANAARARSFWLKLADQPTDWPNAAACSAR